MTIHITTLSENTAGRGDLLGEWGLSVLVETGESMIMLDTGKGWSTIHNADSLGVDLTRIDSIVLSHGHYDHTGGLRELLQRTRKEVKVIAHPDIWQAKYVRRHGDPDKYVGIPYQRNELESLGGVFQLTSQPVHVAKDVMTTGEIPMITPFEEIDASLFVKGASGWRPDQVMDDQALIVKTRQGLVVILGCAHRGMINTLYHAQQLAETSEIQMVIGGSHLISASEDRLRQTIEALKGLGVRKLGLCHCTDLPAASVLAREFGESFFFNKAGTTIQLP